MSVTKEIERLREYPKGATQEFRDQLQRARESRDKLLGVVVGWLMAHLVIVLHNLWIRFVATPRDPDPRAVEFKEMLRAGWEVMDPDEIIERMRRRFHEDAIRHFARALPPPQPTNE